jgi:predicted ArsR family transcriptional regulator
VLGELGGLAEAEHQDGRVFLRCFACPLVLVVAGHPEVCKMVETVLTETLGVPVGEHGQRERVPQCLFEIRKEVS